MGKLPCKWRSFVHCQSCLITEGKSNTPNAMTPVVARVSRVPTYSHRFPYIGEFPWYVPLQQKTGEIKKTSAVFKISVYISIEHEHYPRWHYWSKEV